MELDYCKYCKNQEDCNKYHWCITMDINRNKEGKPICDNFKTEKEI